MKQIIQNRLVPDPMMTPAEFQHQWRKEQEAAEAAGRAPRREIGKVWVAENAVTRIGALCFIRRREPHHEKVGAEFKSLYEHTYGSGNPAVDPGRVQVDTSIIAHDSGMAAKVDRSKALRIAEQKLGRPAFNRLVALLVLEIPAGSDVPLMPSGRPNDRHVKAAIDQVLADLDALDDLWGRSG